MNTPETRPPRWADRFLEWYCRPELLEEIQGDAYELFAKRQKARGPKIARRRFVWDVLRSFRLSTVRKIRPEISPVMLKSNVKIAWRNLAKQKMYSGIKIGGFAIGIAACLLIALYIRDELSYDCFYPNGDRLYRIVAINNQGEYAGKGVDFPAPFAKALKEDFPEIETIGRLNPNTLFTGGGNPMRRADQAQNSYEEGFTFADPEMLKILSIPMVYGDRDHALDEPNSIVISKKIADKYFPDENPVGKTLIFNDNKDNPITVGGVMQDFGSNSHLHFDFLITLNGINFYDGEQENWNASNYHTYLWLREGADKTAFESKMFGAVFDKYVAPNMKKDGMSDDQIAQIRKSVNLELQPVRDIHLHSSDIHDGFSHGDIRFVWLFGAIAIFILVIACINFINLATARAANRAREVGLRKVLGSYRTHLIGQFLTESVLFSFMSFVLGILLARGLLPYFDQLANKTLAFPWKEWWFIPGLAGAMLVVGILAGLYPAFYLSGFRPITVLKGNLSRGSKNATTRSVLVVFQFTTSIVLIIGTIVIARQMHYILHKDLGFDKEQVVLLQGTQTMGDKLAAFKSELLQQPDVKSVTVTDYLPIVGNDTKRNGNQFWEDGKDKNDRYVNLQIWRVDEDYVRTMGMKIAAGRDFSTEMPSDSLAAIINKTMAKKLIDGDPVGRYITNGREKYKVIGVVEDFHFESMRENIGSVCLVLGQSPTITAVKVKNERISAVIGEITAVWKHFSPNQPIRYTFLDERFAQMYDDVQRMERIFLSFAVFAIIVACLGLFALSAYMAEQRSKEIGIRKVLGASVNNILQLLTRNFLLLVLISMVIATPLAWYLMHRWLEDFAYQIPITVDIFALAGLMAVLIALFTVSYQAIRTATGNPVDALRSE